LKIFIPIKENSQRVPRKNFRIFNGLPLYKHTLYKLKSFDIFVDTDSKKIYDEINQDPELAHVTVYKREKKLTGDEVSVCKLIENFIRKFNIKNETLCQIHVTSPFLTLDTLERALQKVGDYDSVVSCNPLQTRLWRQEKYGMCPVNHNPTVLQQTQDLPVYYEENSLFYIFNSSGFLKTGNRIGLNPHFFETTFPENLDIDWESDWELAKVISK
jgi:CMP-N-acetylneuraminic acid synthetase